MKSATQYMCLLLSFSLLLSLPSHVVAQKAVGANTKQEALGGSGQEEDLNRFFGYEEPLVFRYLSTPYDNVMNTNFKSFTVELNFIFLLLLPLAFFFPEKLRFKFWFPALLALILYLCIGIGSSYVYTHDVVASEALNHLQTQQVEGLFAHLQAAYQGIALSIYAPVSQLVGQVSAMPDSFTYPALVLIFLLILWGIKERYQKLSEDKRKLLLFTYFYGALWLLLARGVPWYGLLIFPLLIMLTVYAWGNKRTDTWMPQRVLKAVLYGFAMLWLLMSLGFRMTNYNVGNEEVAKQVFYKPLAYHRNANLNETQVISRFRSGYVEMANLLNQETHSLIYHAGTQIPFFVKKSDARCFSDNFFEFFTKQKQVYGRESRLIKALRAMGFRYFVIDLNLPYIDKTPEQTLKKKYIQFMNFAFRNAAIELIMTDQQVIRNGQVVNDVFLNDAQLSQAGTFALFRLKP